MINDDANRSINTPLAISPEIVATTLKNKTHAELCAPAARRNATTTFIAPIYGQPNEEPSQIHKKPVHQVTWQESGQKNDAHTLHSAKNTRIVDLSANAAHTKQTHIEMSPVNEVYALPSHATKANVNNTSNNTLVTLTPQMNNHTSQAPQPARIKPHYTTTGGFIQRFHTTRYSFTNWFRV